MVADITIFDLAADPPVPQIRNRAKDRGKPYNWSRFGLLQA
jgi:hypothetical protein